MYKFYSLTKTQYPRATQLYAIIVVDIQNPVLAYGNIISGMYNMATYEYIISVCI